MIRNLCRLAVLLLLIAGLHSCRNQGERLKIKGGKRNRHYVSKEEKEPDYRIPVDSFNLIRGRIKPNTFISDILVQHGVPMMDIDILTKNSKAIFDVRNIKSGQDYLLYCDRDSIGRARYMVYEHTPALSYVFSFNDSLTITPVKKEIRSEMKFSSVSIETSLWDAMIGKGLHAKLVSDLEDVFAWSVDFFGLQKGDTFKVIYEELFIGEKSLGTGRIYGASFSSGGITTEAIPFIQKGEESFYDLNGLSLRKAFLKSPLQFSRITSRFSSGRLHPILKIRRPHYGVDYAAPIGTPVHAIGDGRVTSASFEGGAGRMVKIQHNSVYATAYLHLSRFGQGIAAGAHVKQGDIIGYVGSSGLSTGPHLDFRFYKGGSPVDPMKVEAPPTEPVAPENIEKFNRIAGTITNLLKTCN